MYAVASVLCKTLQMSLSVEPGVRYFSDGPTISALASVKDELYILFIDTSRKYKTDKKYVYILTGRIIFITQKIYSKLY